MSTVANAQRSDETKDMASRPRVVVVTQSAFWDKGNGLAERTRELVKFLARETELSVVYLNPLPARELDRIRDLGASFRLHLLADTSREGQPRPMERFRQLFDERSPPASYLIVQTEIAGMVDAIPANGLRLLDTNDLVSDRTASMAAHGATEHFPLTVEQEIALFRRFDSVLCIQRREYEKVCGWIGFDRTLLVPHPVVANPLPLRETVAHIGFAASVWHPNIAGLKWFAERVWPRLAGRGLTLDIYGPICSRIGDWRVPGMRLRGVVDEMADCLSSLDIVINPVQYGAGLKIKTVEAMAAGLPVVTTPQGASGLESLDGTALLIARDEAGFAAHLSLLAQDPAARIRLGREAANYVRDNLSEARCFGGLLQRIRLFHESRV